jgi:hypothetical protein
LSEALQDASWRQWSIGHTRASQVNLAPGSPLPRRKAIDRLRRNRSGVFLAEELETTIAEDYDSVGEIP